MKLSKLNYARNEARSILIDLLKKKGGDYINHTELADKYFNTETAYKFIDQCDLDPFLILRIIKQDTEERGAEFKEYDKPMYVMNEYISILFYAILQESETYRAREYEYFAERDIKQVINSIEK